MGCVVSANGLVVGTESVKRNVEIDKSIKQDRIQSRRCVKLLLLGTGESGKSTIVKQMRIIHMEGYNTEDYIRYRNLVQGNVVTSMITILKAMKKLEIEFDNPDQEYDKDLVMEMESAMDDYSIGIPLKVMEACRDLWADNGVQQCFRRRSEYQLWDCAEFFLTDLDRIGTDDYLANNLDVLRHPEQAPEQGLHFSLFDVGGQRSERKKWIHCFDDVFAIIFCVALSEYDQVLFEDGITNRMHESMHLFEAICNNHYFKNTPIILFLNKTDLFREKLKQNNITKAFPLYKGKPEYEEASNYVRDLFKSVHGNPNREIFVHKTCATDTSNIQIVFDTVFDAIIRINLTESRLIH